MTRTVGTTARGIRAPIIKKGDDIINIVVDCIINSSESEGYEINNKDVIGVTESLIARAQGNYVNMEEITKDINNKYKGDIGVVFPILSRNRFSLILKAIAATEKKIYLMLNYPSDEVGNPLMDIDKMDSLNINPYTDNLTEKKYRELFGEKVIHPFTGIDYVKMYKDLAVNDNIEIHLTNNPTTVLKYTKNVLLANVHDRKRLMKILKNAGAETIYGLDGILNSPVSDGSGYNPEYGLYGSNLATETHLKLFPRDCQRYVDEIQKEMKKRTGKNIEVMIFGDGAFKDPIGKIWELADPLVSPGYTKGLRGSPSEVKIKYLADTELQNLKGGEMENAIKEKIIKKNDDLISRKESIGTTPRQITDLLGSLCDLTSGSGDKGTPIVYIQGYFDNYATE